jgi:hypothetical protein
MTKPIVTVEEALIDILSDGWSEAELVEQLALIRAAALSAVGRRRGVSLASAVRLLDFVMREAVRRVDDDKVGFGSTVHAAAVAAGFAVDLAETPTVSEARH